MNRRGTTATGAGSSESAAGPLVEILYFDGCANHLPAIALVERVSRELGIASDLRLVNVPDAAAAQRLRFLGSPTIRVDGLDVDPNAEERDDYALSCRVFPTEAGIAGQPDERWLREALLREPRAHTQTSSARVAAALEAAAITPARCGSERTRRLSAPELELYRWILERFADWAPPSADTLVDCAASLGLDTAAAVATLASEDLVHVDDHGAVLVAYPFSARPRGHRVLIDNTRTVEAMCAIDALGIAPMLDLPIEITSRDPSTGTDIRIRVHPDYGASWEPESAVVLAGSSCGNGLSFRGCCDVLNFFESPDTADAYLAQQREVSAIAISIPEAFEAGRAVFGDIFKES